ncbi:hypothetical protein [Thioalkalivibrio sp. XN8]|uniref:hypothetical protein n=1 Tax=Thioalkalivibrio sp. XN8 TaxID=2712863 RepID=UPI0013EA55CE|nr:hypothetical protein [Thioalkalivibrio sp. XN8]NGP53514.1 hypothetical protein [Thioalkalivibrio sp. XN8]
MSGRRTLALVLLGLLAGCGSSADRVKERYVKACIAGGDEEAYCACQGEALMAELDEDSFTLLVEFAESMVGASDQAQGQIAMGALSNPRLVAALDKTEATGRTCRQAAARAAASTEVEALMAAREERRKQAAARQCPHTPALAARDPNQPVDDVANLRPGMSFADVEALLECRGDIVNFDTAEAWAIRNEGLPTRQLLRAANGDICPAEARLAGGGECEDGGYGFELLQDVSEEFIVAFTGLPEGERAGVIWRRTVFPADESPTVTSLQEALVAKYGQPHLAANQEGYYSLGHRPGAVTYSWVYDARQQPIPGGDSARRSRCVNGPRPAFEKQMSWNSACGLTVRAEIMTAPGNTLLARELNVVVMDQKRFDDAVKQFNVDLKAAVEAQHRGKAGAPDL